MIIAGLPQRGKSNDSGRMASRGSPNEFQQGDLISVDSLNRFDSASAARSRTRGETKLSRDLFQAKSAQRRRDCMSRSAFRKHLPLLGPTEFTAR